MGSWIRRAGSQWLRRLKALSLRPLRNRRHLNHSWGYCAWDQDWKSAETILAIRKKLNGLGINYLLNVGPDHLGRIPGASVDILREAARRQGAL